MSYGPSYEDQMRRSAEYVDKILKGGKPSGLQISWIAPGRWRQNC
jgi:hypothetical protein